MREEGMAAEGTATAVRTLLVLPGDGIGPEVTAAALGVLEAALRGVPGRLEVRERAIGGRSLDETGSSLTEETLADAVATGTVLLGAVGGPRWDNAADRPEAGLLRLRQGMGVYANLRPFRILPGLEEASPLRPERARDINGVIVRELTGGLYFGQPRGRSITPEGEPEAVDTLRYRRSEIERLAAVGFSLAQQSGQPLTSVDKANVLESGRLWRETVTAMATRWPGVTVEHRYVDAAAMELVLRPQRYRVVITENVFGDILSDLTGGVVGSLGVLPSASLSGWGRGHRGLYEPIHGSAPDIAGQDKADPIGAILSTALLCRYSWELPEVAARIEAAVDRVLAEGLRTADLPGGSRVVGCREFGRRVEDALA
ncbi:MAG: 3-isopropylmalate dehydrogenase [Firmicutes bacterium]|nr:3-isopropylmalate dehydrogenase [Bacillota bacterium]